MYTVTVVGYVRKPSEQEIYLEILTEYWPATRNLDKFSHMVVLWWITERDNPEARKNLQGTPPYAEAETSGVFATRSPARPTPIGLSVVALVELDAKQHRIYIDQIDAFDGTPLIDIKPYMPSSDRVDDAKVPHWFRDNIKRYTT